MNPLRTKPQLPILHNVPAQRDPVPELLVRIRNRDPLAMGQLYDRYGKLAFTLINRLVPNKQLAEDLLAEAFVIAWNRIGRWKDAHHEDFELWLLLLARNHAIDHLRAIGQAPPVRLPNLSVFNNPAVMEDHPHAESAEYWMKLRRTVESLPPEEREILELICFNAVPPAEIAVEKGRSPAEVKEILKRIVQRFRKESGG